MFGYLILNSDSMEGDHRGLYMSWLSQNGRSLGSKQGCILYNKNDVFQHEIGDFTNCNVRWTYCFFLFFLGLSYSSQTGLKLLWTCRSIQCLLRTTRLQEKFHARRDAERPRQRDATAPAEAMYSVELRSEE